MTSPSLLTQFVGVCSVERINAYRTGDEPDIDVLTNYFWDAALCESFYPTLHLLEIGLRNRLNDALTKSYGNREWYADPAVALREPARLKIAQVQRMLLTAGKEVTPPAVISNLSFGFWSGLFTHQYESLCRRPGFLKTAFPYMPKAVRKRVTLSRYFGNARKLRNRVFHHEPIWRHDLEREHTNIVEALGWLDPCLQRLCVTLDRFVVVHTESFRQQIKHKLVRACPVESKKFGLARKQ